MNMNYYVNLGILAILILMNLLQFKTYIYKYHLVNEVQKERMEQIYYYQDHPEGLFCKNANYDYPFC